MAALTALALAAVLAAIGWSLHALSTGERRVATTAEKPRTPAAASEIIAALDSARTYLNRQEPGRAEAVLVALLEKAPRDQEARMLLAETYLLLERPNDAYEQYAEAIEIGPVHAELAFAAGTVANTIGMPYIAEAHYVKAQEADPTNPKHPLYLAQIQRKLGSDEEAKASLLRAVTLDPSLDIGWGVLADMALEENNLSIARMHIERARRIAPGSISWRILEARILRRDNNPEGAARVLRSLDDELILEDPVLLDELAKSYAMLGRPEDAAALYMTASARRTRDADMAYLAAVWLERAERFNDAEIYAQAAVGLGHEDARALLERIRSKRSG
ncbi:MAG: hypothetical protein EA379_11205 [Phycisphaerales bacterium]|nr:MAG: hypothetical protein EA379_11205 [Phycisphaerales bacterium]